jgi:translation initiation factor 1
MAQCACRKSAPPPKGDGIVRVGRETKGRKGSGVTIVTGLPLGGAELAELASQLKRRCGSGGTVKDGVIEIQGDHRDQVVAELQKQGYVAKRAGG